MDRRNGFGAVWFALLAVACGQTSRSVNDAIAGGAGGPSAGAGGTTVARSAGGGGSLNGPITSAPSPAAGAEAFGGISGSVAGGMSTGLADGSDAGAVSGSGGAGAVVGSAGASGTGAAGGGTGMGGAGAVGGNAGASGGACPVWPVKAASLPAEVTFNGVTIKSAEHDCAWSLGNSVKLPVTVTHTRMLFHYDVNGDGVDDLFVGPNLDLVDPAPPAAPYPRTITVLLSRLDGSVLSFQPTDCALAAPLVDGSYALRDLDGDGVSDFVISVSTGFRVVMNRPSGPELTIAYDFPNVTQPRLSMRDVVLGAFEQNSSSELAVGFLRVDNFASTHSGVLLFPDPTHATGQSPVALVSSDQAGNGFDVSTNPQLGVFTALPGGRALLGASTQDTWIYQNGQRTNAVGGIHLGNGDAPYMGGASYLHLISVGGHDRVLAAVGDTAYAFDPQDPKQYLKIPMAFAEYSAALLVDVDGDGDLDLMDTQIGATTPSIGIHNGDLTNGPAAQSFQFTPDRYRAPSSDTPFLAIGAAKGRLLVSDADRADVRGFPLSVSALGCGK